MATLPPSTGSAASAAASRTNNVPNKYWEKVTSDDDVTIRPDQPPSYYDDHDLPLPAAPLSTNTQHFTASAQLRTANVHGGISSKE